MKFIELYKDTYYINDNNIVKSFLLLGKSKALLIGSCMTIKNIKECVKEVTDLPIELINTHCDIDHVGGNNKFDKVYLHELEKGNYIDSNLNGEIISVKENDEIDLGERKIKIIEIPGHTEGSIGIIDIDNRVLFSGDAIQKNATIYMFDKYRNMRKYIEGLQNIKTHFDEFDFMYSSHGDLMVDKELIDGLIVDASKILNGEIKPTKKVNLYGKVVDYYDVGCGSFYYE